jgi:hypothetical protein
MWSSMASVCDDIHEPAQTKIGNIEKIKKVNDIKCKKEGCKLNLFYVE